MCGGTSRNISELLIPLLAQASGITAPMRETVIQNQITCPNCFSSIKDDYSWCPVCGAALRSQPCVYCGQILSPKDKNCQHCGAPREAVKDRHRKQQISRINPLLASCNTSLTVGSRFAYCPTRVLYWDSGFIRQFCCSLTKESHYKRETTGRLPVRIVSPDYQGDRRPPV